MQAQMVERGFDLSALRNGVTIFEGGYEVHVFSDKTYGRGYRVFDPFGQRVAERSGACTYGNEVLRTPELSTMKVVMVAG